MGQKTGMSKMGNRVAIIDKMMACVDAYLPVASEHRRQVRERRAHRERARDGPELELGQTADERPELAVLVLAEARRRHRGGQARRALLDLGLGDVLRQARVKLRPCPSGQVSAGVTAET